MYKLAFKVYRESTHYVQGVQNLCARVFGIVLFSLVALPLGVNAAEGSSSDYPRLNFSAGAIGIADSIDEPFLIGVEYQMPAFSDWALIPAVGFLYSQNGAGYVYGGLRHDFQLSDEWVLTPSLSAGYFDDSDEIDLGYALEFRSGIEVAYKLPGKSRLGLGVFHISNASLGDRNPGTELMTLSWSMPIGN